MQAKWYYQSSFALPEGIGISVIEARDTLKPGSQVVIHWHHGREFAHPDIPFTCAGQLGIAEVH